MTENTSTGFNFNTSPTKQSPLAAVTEATRLLSDGENAQNVSVTGQCELLKGKICVQFIKCAVVMLAVFMRKQRGPEGSLWDHAHRRRSLIIVFRVFTSSFH